MNAITSFSVAGSGRRTEGEYAIYPNAKIFQAGDYPDKQFSMTAQELASVPNDFSPVFGNIEHTDFLRGRACRVNSVRAEGDELRGEVSVPLALDALMEDGERKLSAEWDRASKRLVGVALTVTPRVMDAVLMSALHMTDAPPAAFAGTRHNTPTGQVALQDLHDAACRSGAVCDRKNTADMSSQHEATAIQKIHDVAADHGATCQKGEAPPWAKSNFSQPLFTQSMFSLAPADPANHKEKSTMSKTWDDFVAWFGGKPAEPATTPPPATAAPVPSETAEFAAMKSEFERMKAERAVETAAKLTADAEAFAAAEVAACRALPVDKPFLVAAFTQAAQDDAASPATVTFSTGAETVTGSRVDALKAHWGSRPPHGLNTELLANDTDAAALAARFSAAAASMNTARAGDEKPLTPERRAALLNLTPLGKTALNGKN